VVPTVMSKTHKPWWTGWPRCRPTPRFRAERDLAAAIAALLAQARVDEKSYRDNRDRYRDMATELGFEGHIAWAEAME
jgi:hypothetical protein